LGSVGQLICLVTLKTSNFQVKNERSDLERDLLVLQREADRLIYDNKVLKLNLENLRRGKDQHPML
jgi:hypothetical protein